MHFTLKENTDSILQNGLQPNLKKPMCFFEKNMVWLYIADRDFKDTVREIHRKGDRSAYDAVVFFRKISDDCIKNMKFRKHDEAIVHIGALKSSEMEAKSIYEILND